MDNTTNLQSSGFGSAYGASNAVELAFASRLFDHHGYDTGDILSYEKGKRDGKSATKSDILKLAEEIVENRHETEKAISHLAYNFKDNLCDLRSEMKENKYDLSRQMSEGFCEVKEREYEKEIRRQDQKIEELQQIAHGNFPLSQQAHLVKADPCAQSGANGGIDINLIQNAVGTAITQALTPIISAISGQNSGN